MLHGWHLRLEYIALSDDCCHPKKPHAGVVLPHMDITLVPTSDARCILAESIDIIMSSCDISDNSSSIVIVPAIHIVLLLFNDVSNNMSSFEPNKNILNSFIQDNSWITFFI